MKAIDRIIEIPSVEKEDDVLRQFFIAAIYVLTYAPDRGTIPSLQKAQKEFYNIFGKVEKIERYLENNFFKDLYVDRDEREEIVSLLPAKRLIIVQGLVGVGKTVLLKRIEQDLNSGKYKRMAYFDLKAHVETILKMNRDRFDMEFRNFMYNKIYRDFINNDLLNPWIAYKVYYDPNYTKFREMAIDFARKVPNSVKEWQNILNDNTIKRKLFEIEETIQPAFSTLLNFLRDQYGNIVLCLDNVDRFHIHIQRRIFSIGLDLSNEAQIPVIIAIREQNLRRLQREGDRGDPVYFDIIKPMDLVKNRRGNNISPVTVKEMGDKSIQELLRKRLEVLRKKEIFYIVKPAIERFLERYKLNFNDLSGKFWSVFQDLNKTFVEKGANKYCNYCIREILVFYVEFVFSMLLGVEKPYSLEELIPSGKKPRMTKLRNYFYKWLVCGGDLLPRENGQVLNIYNMISNKHASLYFIELHVLEYLYNLKERRPSNRIYFEDLPFVFGRLGISSDQLKKIIYYLSTEKKWQPLGMVYSDDVTDNINSQSIIQLMPAGEYFITVLSISREYAFWNILMTDLDKNIVRGKFRFDRTYNDKFKLDIVYRFVKEILFPAFEKEVDYVYQNLQPPRGWDDSNINFYFYHFSLNGHLYPYRLLESVKSTIKYSDMSSPEKIEYEDKYQELLEKFSDFEDEWKSM